MLPTRRTALKALFTLPLIVPASRTFAAASRTPSATEGPFYPRANMRFADADNNLVKIEGVVERAGGEIMILTGRVLDRAGRDAEGARIEIWQCDANGRYLHTGDRGGAARDPAFQGFGYVVTGSDGIYSFRTIKPVSYPGRTPHIHVKAFHLGQTLTTQFYLARHPQNRRDGLYRRMSKAQQSAVSMVLDTTSGEPEARVDIRF